MIKSFAADWSLDIRTETSLKEKQTFEELFQAKNFKTVS